MKKITHTTQRAWRGDDGHSIEGVPAGDNTLGPLTPEQQTYLFDTPDLRLAARLAATLGSWSCLPGASRLFDDWVERHRHEWVEEEEAAARLTGLGDRHTA